MKTIRFFFLAFLLVVNLYPQPIIINEIYNSSGNDEWIEFLVVEDNLDIRNWSIRDFSSGGSPQQPLVFSNHSLWSNLRKGTLVVIARPENTFSENLDPGDYLLIVKSNNAQFLSGTPFSIAGGSEAVQIRNASQEHIFGVSWGSSNANSIPQPKVHFTGSSSSNTSIFFNEGSLAELLNTANWTMNGTPTLGAGNTTNNINWILSLRDRPEGSGIVSFSPETVTGDSVITIVFNYKRDPQYNVNALRIIFPEEVTWTQNAAQISQTNFTSSITVTGDTVLFSNVNFANDSVLVSISEVTTPFFTGRYRFSFQSGVGNVLDDVSPAPVLTVYGAPIPIADAKVNDENGIALLFGELVSIRGIVTVANHFGSPSYVQDNSGGISIFSPSFSGSVQIGDEVFVSGTVTQFNGLNQLEFPILHSVISTGNSVEPLIATPAQLSNDGIGGVEYFEGRLVRVNNVIVTELNGTAVSNWAYKNYLLTGTGPNDVVEIRIDNDTEIIGTVAPAGRFDVVGVLSQFKPSLPYIGGYQVMPRMLSDIISTGPIIEKFPEEVDLTPNSITLEWETINPGTSRIRYGTTTNYELGVIEPDNDLRRVHNVTVSGLNVAAIYNLQAFSVSNTDTSFSGNIISSTTSAPPTTGEIRVHFNKNVEPGVAIGPTANNNVNFANVVIQRINNAKHSVDVALYSLSGNVGANIATALVNAKNRGVKVRVIGEYDTRTTAPWNTLINNGIPYINDAFGSNDGAGLHHNKFFIFDFRGGAPDSIWLLTGSWNPTDPGTFDDRQNIVEIQDVALAGAYTREFEEMWGSNSDIPSAVNSRFGSRKQNNTPHNFIVGGVRIQSYFSPSDQTTSHIARTLSKAYGSINGSIMTFTRRDLADTVIAVKNRGRKARIILSNNTDTGTQFFHMQSNGVDIRLKNFSPGLLHHKYAIVDGEYPGYSPYVITGSHNWSSAAENSNDENTLIIQDAQIANFYLQEFAARYYEANGSDSIIVVTTIDTESETPNKFSLSQNYPNPFNPVTTIRFEMPFTQKAELKVFDVLGREVKELFNDIAPAGIISIEFRADELASGVYIYRLKTESFVDSKKMIIMK